MKRTNTFIITDKPAIGVNRQLRQALESELRRQAYALKKFDVLDASTRSAPTDGLSDSQRAMNESNEAWRISPR